MQLELNWLERMYYNKQWKNANTNFKPCLQHI